MADIDDAPTLVPLTANQCKHLRGLAHGLSPVVQVGHKGLSDPVVHQVDGALDDHELIKVKIGQNSSEDRDAMATALAEALGCHVVQTIGRVVTLYREAEEPDDRRIKLP